MEPDLSPLLSSLMLLVSVLIVVWVGKQILIGLGLV